MDQQKLFEQILREEVFKVPAWHNFIPVVLKSGITSIETLAATDDNDLDDFEIPPIPLKKLKVYREQLKAIGKRCDDRDSFSQPLNENLIFRNYIFVPRFTPIEYISEIPQMGEKEQQIKTAVETANSINGAKLIHHQSIMIALYCQEGRVPQTSFYYRLNRALRSREQDLPLFRPSLYLLHCALKSLPSVELVTWRGQNQRPDLNKFVVGKIVCFTGICSTSINKMATLRFIEKSPPKGVEHCRTLFKLCMKTGYSIKEWSQYKNEEEIVANFCSRWLVTKVNLDHLENFQGIGNQICDVYIELEQLDYEPLFDNPIESSVCGLHLLSMIDTSKIPQFQNDFKEQFISLFESLNNSDAQNILEQRLDTYWDSQKRRFKEKTQDRDAKVAVLNILMGAQELSAILTDNQANVNKCMIACQNNQIYDTYNLLYVKENTLRTIEQFQEMGICDDDSRKLSELHSFKETYQKLYAKIRGLHGDVDNPKNVSKWLKDNRFKHYIIRDGVVMTLYQAVQVIFDLVVCCKGCIPGSKEICQFTIKNSTVALQNADIIIPVIITAVHLGSYAYQWYCGDITLRQMIKSICVTLTSCIFGFVAAFLVFFLVPGIGGVILAAIAGGVAGGLSEYVTRKIVEHLFPDGKIEEINAKRLLYHKALKHLGCDEKDSFQVKLTKYRKLTEVYLVKRESEKQYKITDNEMRNYWNVVAAYEIVKSYEEVLDGACKMLKIQRETLAKEKLEEWRKENQQSISNSDEAKSCYNILKMHVDYSKKDTQWLQKKLNMHKVADISLESSNFFEQLKRLCNNQ